MSGSSPDRVLRRLALAVPLLAGLLSGCEADDRYPEGLTYLPRTDPLVIDPPKVEPWNPDGPGQLDHFVARIGLPKDQGGIGTKSEGGGEALDPMKLPADLRNEVQKELKTLFNIPQKPRVEAQDSEAQELATKVLAVGELSVNRTLYEGSILYRRHCLHCHGLDGDGRGPTGPWLNPHPRDYRQGQFKFISTDVTLKKGKDRIKELKPRREDLLRTLRQGIDGTSMPSFGLQSDQELNQIVSYVIHLSLRGQVEFDTLRALLEARNPKTNAIDLESLEGGSVATHVQARLAELLKAWAGSNRSNKPPDYPYNDSDKAALQASIKRGYELFSNKSKGAGCISCHIDFGRQVPYKYDVWGTLVRPANLTTGVYRGGRRPIDLYWRIRGGIPPSQMPESEDIKKLADNSDPYWDLVNFVQALPYRNMLPEDVSKQIYTEPAAHTAEHAAAE